MHHNAQLAVVGVSLVLVDVRYLGDGKERQQEKAQCSDNRQGPLPKAAFVTELRLQGRHPWGPRRSHSTQELICFDGEWAEWLPGEMASVMWPTVLVEVRLNCDCPRRHARRMGIAK